MKCVLFTSVLSGGGAERVLCQLANRLATEHHVILVAAYPSENEYPVADNINKVYLDTAIENKKPIKQLILLRKVLKEQRPDVCISFLPQPNFKMLLAALGLKTRVIVSVRNDPAKEYAKLSSRLLARFLYPMAAGVVFQTKDAQAWFPKHIQRKSRVIMNQVNPTFFTTQRVSEDYFVATGRLNNQKNYPLMIKAFAKFSKEFPQEKLYIFGTGQLREELSALINELDVSSNIVLQGASNDIPTVLSHTKAFLLTSDYEGMPNGLLEAMAMGIPCIATNCPCGGPKQIIDNGINGILINVSDEDALLDALHKVHNDSDFRKDIASRAKASSRKYHPDEVYRDWEAYISEIVK